MEYWKYGQRNAIIGHQRPSAGQWCGDILLRLTGLRRARCEGVVGEQGGRYLGAAQREKVRVLSRAVPGRDLHDPHAPRQPLLRHQLIAPCMSIFFRSSCSVLVLVLEVLVAVNASTRDVKVLRQAGLRPEFWSWFRSWSGGFGLLVSRTNVCARS